jgi:SPP1 gp7 family putative phage head morphogenesis protein
LKWETGKWNYTAVSLKLNSGRVAKVFVIESVFRADSWSDDLSRLMAAFRHTVGDIVPTERLKTLLLNIGQWSSKWNDEQWQKTLHAVLGVSVYGKEDEIGSRIESFVNENTILIKDLEEQVYQDVRLTIERGIRSGDSQRDIMKALLADTELERGVFAKVKTRARLIARDQINKINGDITRSRQEGIGIEEYYWRGVGDSRERDSHYEMNDTLCRWDDADVYSNDDGKTWEDRPEDMKGLIPGEDYQCRCWAEPVFGEEFEYQGEDAAIAA